MGRRSLVFAAVAGVVAVLAVPSGASGRTYLPDCTNGLTFKPPEIIYGCADAGVIAGHIRWSRWGDRKAVGRTRHFTQNDCVPDCASGRFHRYRARIRLSRARACPEYPQPIFTRITTRFVGRKPAGPRKRSGPVNVLGPDGCGAGVPLPSDPTLYFATSPDTAGSPYEVRPRRVAMEAPFGLYVTGLKWRRWGRAVAVARGVAHQPPDGRTDPARLEVLRVGRLEERRQYLCWRLTVLSGPNRGVLVNRCRPGTPPAPIPYVGLGDSYSSGEGIPPYLPGTDTPEDRCHRSPQAYPSILGQPGFGGVSLSLRFFACSGAVVANMTSRRQNAGEGTFQLGRLTRSAWRKVGLVTFSIGGNDANFARVLRECANPKGRCARKGPKQREILARVDRLAETLPPVYRRVKKLATNATIVVLGYPQLFAHGVRYLCPKVVPIFPVFTQRFINRMAVRLRDVTQRAAERAGLFFLDAIPPFRDHEICGKQGEWINFIVGSPLHPEPASFHPNPSGQMGYATMVGSFLQRKLSSSWPVNGFGLPRNP